MLLFSTVSFAQLEYIITVEDELLFPITDLEDIDIGVTVDGGEEGDWEDRQPLVEGDDGEYSHWFLEYE